MEGRATGVGHGRKGALTAKNHSMGEIHMSKRKPITKTPAPEGLAPAHDEVGPAVRDVAYQLTHDLSDTRSDLRDAVAFAPLAAVKLVQRCARYLAARPRRSLSVLAGLAAVVVAGAALTRRKRS